MEDAVQLVEGMPEYTLAGERWQIAMEAFALDHFLEVDVTGTLRVHRTQDLPAALLERAVEVGAD